MSVPAPPVPVASRPAPTAAVRLATGAERARRRLLPVLLMLASGFAGLGYQIVWTQQSALWLGHESAAMLAVVTAFFGGLAVGALATGSGIERSARPVRWYAACEAMIAAWSLALLVGMAPVTDWLMRITGAGPSPLWQWTVAFLGTFFVLLPATAAMGATLPAIERVVAVRPGGRSIAGLYACNTGGAVIGVLCTTFWLVPSIGLARTSAVCIVLNVFCAAASLLLPTRAGAEPGPADRPAADEAREAAPTSPVLRASARPATGGGARRVLLQIGLTGFLGIGYEVLVVRVLSQVSEDTVYTFAMLLAVYLVGSAAGAAAWQRRFVRRADRPGPCGRIVADRLLVALATACLVGTASLWFAAGVRDFLLGVGDGGLGVAVGAEAALALFAFALPTFVMGALFSELGTAASAAGVAFGRALGINIAGAALAPLVFGVLVAPALGAKPSMLLVAAGYLLLGSRRAWKTPTTWVPAVAVATVAFAAPPLVFVDVPAGGHVVSYREGVAAAVSVVEDAHGVLRLRIDNRQQEGSNSSALVDGRQALLPVLLHPAPHRALFLGLGTGITASSAAELPGLDVDAVELLPEVVVASRAFTRVFADGQPNPRLHLLTADARRYVRASAARYDVVVADNFHPARGGSGALYTVEHFRAVRDRLADGGLFCQWIPLHQLDLDTLRSVVRSFVVVYPHAQALLASNSLGTPVIGFIGGRTALRFDLRAVHERLAASALPEGTAAFGIDDEFALLGSFVAGPAALARFAAAAPPNTDDRPVVAYAAPRATYGPQELPQDRLVALLGVLSVSPDEVVDPATDGASAARLARYWAARDRFIEAGRNVRPSGDVRAMLAQVGQPLLDVLSTSADFRPAYDPLLRMAIALARVDRAEGERLLARLVVLQPARPDARMALTELDARPADPDSR